MKWKEAKQAMECLLPDGVWHIAYSHWQHKGYAKTMCDIYIEQSGKATQQCHTWRECINWAQSVLYPVTPMVQDDPDTEEKLESGYLDRAETQAKLKEALHGRE